MIPSFSNIKIITSEYAVVEYQKVVGVPFKRKPNTRRPYYRWVKLKRYPVYVIRGGTAVLHPSMIAKIINGSLDQQINNSFLGTTATTPDPDNQTLTAEKFQEMMESFPKPPLSVLESLYKPLIPDPIIVDDSVDAFRWQLLREHARLNLRADKTGGA